MQIVIGGTDRYLSENLGRILQEQKLGCIRTNKIERIILELKKPDRLAIIDANWEEIQEPGILRRLVNIGRISGNRIICICPNQDEKLKKMALRSRVDEVFIRYDLETRFRDYLKML